MELMNLLFEYKITVGQLNSMEADYKQAQERAKKYKAEIDELEKKRRALVKKIDYSKNRKLLAPHIPRIGLSYQDFA